MQIDYVVTEALEEPHKGDASARELAFEDFYELEFKCIFTAALAFCGRRDLALDATQEAFGRAFARWKRLSKEPWVVSWVMTTAFNYCRRHTRSAKLILGRRAPDPGPTEDRVDMVAALRTLAPRQRTAVLLFYIGDLPVRAVADSMGISEGAVKAHLSKARDALRKRLIPQGSGGSRP